MFSLSPPTREELDENQRYKNKQAFRLANIILMKEIEELEQKISISTEEVKESSDASDTAPMSTDSSRLKVLHKQKAEL